MPALVRIFSMLGISIKKVLHIYLQFVPAGSNETIKHFVYPLTRQQPARPLQQIPALINGHPRPHRRQF